MNVNVAQRDLHERLSFLAKGLSKDRPVVLVDARADGRVELTADHGDLFARAVIPAAVVEPGRCLLPAASATDIVATFPRDTLALRYTEAKGKIELRCGRIRSTLTAPALAEDFPESGIPPEPAPDTLPSELLRRLLTAAGYAQAAEHDRIVLTGAQLRLADSAIGLVTTDGLRLAVALAACPGLHAAESAVIVPGAFLRDLAIVLHDAERASLVVTPTRVIARCGALTLAALPLAGAYPDYGAIVPRPTDQTPTLVCDRASLSHALRAVAVIARENAQTVVVRWADGDVQIRANAAETGEAHGALQGRTVGALEVHLNARFLADAVAAIPGERVRVSAQDPKRPIRVEPESAPTDVQQLAVIMPVLT